MEKKNRTGNLPKGSPVTPSSRPRGAACPPLDPPHMSPGPVVLERTPEGREMRIAAVPLSPGERIQWGGEPRRVPPLAVGEGFQRKPPRNRFPLAAFFLRFLSPPERNRTAGGTLPIAPANGRRGGVRVPHPSPASVRRRSHLSRCGSFRARGPQAGTCVYIGQTRL